MPMKDLTTPRLRLRRFCAGDAPAAFANYGSDPKVNRYISFAPCASLESAEGFVQMHLDRYESDPDFYGWAITLGEKDEVIGSIGLFNIEGTHQCELGYSLGSAWWGAGLATEAACAVRDFTFGELGVHRLYASHHVDNVASGRVLQKIGMQREGVMRDGQENADGTFADLVLYAILSTD